MLQQGDRHEAFATLSRFRGEFYDCLNGRSGLNKGRLDVARLRRTIAGIPLPKAAESRLVLAVDVSPWLRPDAATCPDRSFCHTYGRGDAKHQMIPGWPYSVVAALETGRTSWTALLDTIRLQPSADIEPLLPTPAAETRRGGRPEKWPRREIVDAIRYVVDTGCKRRAMPADYPP